MLHRIFNRGGHWHRPATLNPADWSTFDFEMNWKNLNKMNELRYYYLEIAPPFSKESIGRVHEIEMLVDDLFFYQARYASYRLLFWIFATVFLIDFESMDAPFRHPMSSDQGNHDFPFLREGFMS